MPRLGSLRFDTTGWRPVERTRHSALWTNDHGDELVLLLLFGEPGLPATGDVRGPIHEYLTAAAGADHRIVVRAVDRVPVAGLTAVVALLRAPLPDQPNGFKYGALILLPFARFTYTLMAFAAEHGITGVREAMGHMWAHLATGDAHTPLTPEQEQILDAVLPAHPQARVQTYLDELLGSLAVGPDLAAAVPWPPTRLPTSAGSLEVRDGAVLRRRAGGRLVGRFPLAAVRAVRLDVGWSPLLIVCTVAAIGGAVYAATQWTGWWATGGAGGFGFLALLCAMGWRSLTVVVETAAGTFGWPTFTDRWIAAAFCDHAATLLPPAEGA